MLLGSSRLRDAGADNSTHSRDEGLKNQGHHKAQPDLLYDKAYPKKPVKCYRPADFTYDAVAGTFTCPAGKLFWNQLTQLGLGRQPGPGSKIV
ncbi:MAG: hypothetical protein U1A72_21235 [Sulfuritalea sp.]|nr:hypothetical protein [Sulfuritalea sp.]